MKVIPLIVIPAAFIIIAVLAFVARGKATTHVNTDFKHLAPESPKEAEVADSEPCYDVIESPLRQPGESSEVSKSIKQVTVKSNLKRYRTAVVAGNKRAQTSLLSALKREHHLALDIAFDELQVARTEGERNSISQAIEAIRR